MSKICLNFEEKVKVFSERQEHEQLPPGPEVQSTFKNEQVGLPRCHRVGNRNQETIQDGKFKKS